MADNDIITNKLQKKPWKVWMSSAPEPSAVLVSAADLINGTRLGHNLFILNENVYSAGTFNGNYEQFYRYAIDISPAVFDKRAKTKVVNFNIANMVPKGTINNLDPIKFYIQDKDAALYPEDLKTSFAVNSTWKNWMRPISTLSQNDTTTSYQTNEMFTVLAKTTDADVSSDIYASDTDEVFSSTMVFEDGKKAYTKLTIQATQRIVKLLLGAVLLNSDAASNTIGSADLLTDFIANASTANEVNQIFNNLVNAKVDDKPLLSYIYFWVKAPFCADYIDPADFNQNLNQDSSVTFKNLLLANNYNGVRNNFERYAMSNSYDTQSATIEEFLEKLSRPYCPANSPMKDLLSEKLMLLSGVGGDTIRDKAAALIENSYEEDSIIGSVLVSPIDNPTSKTRLTPFNFYDPESREDEDFYADLGRLPTLIGRDGNLTLDGRIMSPTIDELWYIIKKMILGVSNEATTKLSVPTGDYYKNTDTSLFEATKQFIWDGIDGTTVKGDPIDYSFSINEDGDVNGITVSEWVTNPESLSLNIDFYINETSKTINTFFDAQNPDDAGTRGIYRTGGTIALNDGHYISGHTAVNQEYGPRSVPMSMRELEAAILGLKYNIDNNFIFDSKTYAVTGKFGKIDKDEDGVIIAAGSLYQLHRDYNGDVANPNTVFKMGADNTGNNGRDATFGDLNNQEELHSNGTKVYLLDANHKRTTKVKVSGMPLLVENYGKSVSLAAEQGEYTGSDVYMAADGTFRYKAEHMRLPILRSRY